MSVGSGHKSSYPKEKKNTTSACAKVQRNKNKVHLKSKVRGGYKYCIRIFQRKFKFSKSNIVF